jgi:hypothetical protein
MSDTDKPQNVFVRVHDRSGKEFICPLNALKDPATVSPEELLHCFDTAQEAFSDEEIIAIIKSDLQKE